MAAPGPWVVFNEFGEALAKKQIDLSADVFKVALFQSTSNCGNKALVSAVLATLTNQVAQANGYLTGGVAVTPALTRTTNVTTWDTSDASWTAAGGNIVARFAVLYDDTAANKNLVAYCLLDSAPADVTVFDTNTFSVQVANILALTV